MALIVVGLLLVIMSFFFVRSLESVSVTDVVIDSLASVDENGFTLTGSLTLQNEGWLPVKFHHADYEILLVGNNAKLSSGTVQGFALPPSKPVVVPFTARVDWKDIGPAAFELLRARQGEVIVKGVVVINQDFRAQVAFEEELDLTPFFKEVFEKQTDTLVNRLMGVLNNAFDPLD